MNISTVKRRETQYLRPEMEVKTGLKPDMLCNSLTNNSSEDLSEDVWEF